LEGGGGKINTLTNVLKYNAYKNEDPEYTLGIKYANMYNISATVNFRNSDLTERVII
jgi:hypothetical protein